MLPAGQEEHQAPLKPSLRPIEAEEIDEFSLELDFDLMCLESSDLGKSNQSFKIEEEETVEQCGEEEDTMDSDQTSLKRRHRETREFGCNIRRSMLSKLDQLDRAPAKRRHC